LFRQEFYKITAKISNKAILQKGDCLAFSFSAEDKIFCELSVTSVDRKGHTLYNSYHGNDYRGNFLR